MRSNFVVWKVPSCGTARHLTFPENSRRCNVTIFPWCVRFTWLKDDLRRHGTFDGHVDRVEAMSGPFMWELVGTSTWHCFSPSISRTLRLHEIITAHKLWTKLTTRDLLTWQTAVKGSEPLVPIPHLGKGCHTKSGRRQLEEGCV